MDEYGDTELQMTVMDDLEDLNADFSPLLPPSHDPDQYTPLFCDNSLGTRGRCQRVLPRAPTQCRNRKDPLEEDEDECDDDANEAGDDQDDDFPEDRVSEESGKGFVPEQIEGQEEQEDDDIMITSQLRQRIIDKENAQLFIQGLNPSDLCAELIKEAMRSAESSEFTFTKEPSTLGTLMLQHHTYFERMSHVAQLATQQLHGRPLIIKSFEQMYPDDKSHMSDKDSATDQRLVLLTGLPHSITEDKLQLYFPMASIIVLPKDTTLGFAAMRIADSTKAKILSKGRRKFTIDDHSVTLTYSFSERIHLKFLRGTDKFPDLPKKGDVQAQKRQEKKEKQQLKRNAKLAGMPAPSYGWF